MIATRVQKTYSNASGNSSRGQTLSLSRIPTSLPRHCVTEFFPLVSSVRMSVHEELLFLEFVLMEERIEEMVAPCSANVVLARDRVR